MVRATDRIETGTTGRISIGSAGFDSVLARIAEGAAKRDADPASPEGPLRALADIAGLALDAALESLVAKSAGREPDDIVSLADGRMFAAQATVGRWLEHAAREADADLEKSLAHLSTPLRVVVAESCREILDKAARACGSRPFAVADPLDRARRDLELFLLQHRLKPALVRTGRQASIEDRSRS